MSPHSLRTRLLAWLLAATIAAAVAEAAFAYTTALQQSDVIFDRHLRTMATALTSGAALGQLPPNGEVNADRAGEDFVVQLWNAKGEPIFRSAAHQKLRQPAQPGFSLVQALDGREYRVYSVATPGLTVLVSQDMNARREMARTLALHTALPELPTAPLMALLVWLVVSRSLAPVARLRAQMAAQREELQTLARRLLTVQEDERRTLSRELHDDIGQQLTAIKLGAMALQDETVPVVRNELLAEILATVAAGDPFIAENGERLRRMGFALLVYQLGDLALGVIDHWLDLLGADTVPWFPSLGGWLVVLLLFVLARVFAVGAAMRDDLEGTV